MAERSDFLCLCKVLATLPKKARIIENLEVDLLISRNFEHAHRQKMSDLFAMYEENRLRAIWLKNNRARTTLWLISDSSLELPAC
tara:strand:+ start:4340 stop:4594 length:255 start_codon:yes stop_codon:yes gene_type:complete